MFYFKNIVLECSLCYLFANVLGSFVATTVFPFTNIKNVLECPQLSRVVIRKFFPFESTILNFESFLLSDIYIYILNFDHPWLRARMILNLTNKAVGTIWLALSKPTQRRQGPDRRPLWLLVGTPSAFGPEIAYRLHVAKSTLMDVNRYFWYTFILLLMFVYHIFMTSPFWLAFGPQSI